MHAANDLKRRNLIHKRSRLESELLYSLEDNREWEDTGVPYSYNLVSVLVGKNNDGALSEELINNFFGDGGAGQKIIDQRIEYAIGTNNTVVKQTNPILALSRAISLPSTTNSHTETQTSREYGTSMEKLYEYTTNCIIKIGSVVQIKFKCKGLTSQIQIGYKSDQLDIVETVPCLLTSERDIYIILLKCVESTDKSSITLITPLPAEIISTEEFY